LPRPWWTPSAAGVDGPDEPAPREALAGGPDDALPGPEFDPPGRPLEPEFPFESSRPRPRRRWFELDELDAAPSSCRLARRCTVLRITSVRTSWVGWPALVDAAVSEGPLGCDSAAAAPTLPMAAIVPSAVSRFR
jgi:hypothetical protein